MPSAQMPGAFSGDILKEVACVQVYSKRYFLSPQEISPAGTVPRWSQESWRRQTRSDKVTDTEFCDGTLSLSGDIKRTGEMIWQD